MTCVFAPRNFVDRVEQFRQTSDEGERHLNERGSLNFHVIRVNPDCFGALHLNASPTASRHQPAQDNKAEAATVCAYSAFTHLQTLELLQARRIGAAQYRDTPRSLELPRKVLRKHNISRKGSRLKREAPPNLDYARRQYISEWCLETSVCYENEAVTVRCT